MKRALALSICLMMIALVFTSISVEAAPHVENTAPADGDAGVSINTDVLITFSEQMITTTTIPAITIEPDNGSSVRCKDANGFLAKGCLTYKITTIPSLMKATTYTVRISSSATNVTMVKMSHSYTFTFTTESATSGDVPTVAYNWFTSNIILVLIIAILIIVLVVAYFRRK